MMNTSTLTKITGLATAAVLALSLSACGGGEEVTPEPPAPVSTVTNEPVETSKPVETPVEKDVPEELDADNLSVGTWADVEIIVPEGADEAWGADAAKVGIKSAYDAVFNLAIDGAPAGTSVEDTDRKASDFEIVKEYFSADIADAILTDVTPAAIAGDAQARATIETIFPQVRFDEGMEWEKGVKALDTVTPGTQEYIINSTLTQRIVENDDYLLNVEIDMDVLYHGEKDGKAAQFDTNRVIRVTMAPAGDGSWNIVGFNTLSAKAKQ